MTDQGGSNFKWDAFDLNHHVDLNIFEKKSHTDRIALPPFWLLDPLKGVAEDFDKGLGRWKTSLNGYLVAYENIDYEGSPVGDIYYDQPWTYIDVRATFYTYKPSVGQILEGTIKKVAGKAALCTVFNCFSATVYPCRQDELHSWQVGSQIEFKVTIVENRRKGPVIRATSCGTEATTAEYRAASTTKQENTILTFNDQHDVEDTDEPAKKKPKKHRKNESFQEVTEFVKQERDVEEHEEIDEHNKIKKHKKDKSLKEVVELIKLEQDVEEIDEESKKKKKKHKKDKSFKEVAEIKQEQDDVEEHEEIDEPKRKKKHRKDKSFKEVAEVVKLEQDVEEHEEIDEPKKKHKKDKSLRIKQEFD